MVKVIFASCTFTTLFDCRHLLSLSCPGQGRSPIYHYSTTLNSLLLAIGDEVVTKKESSLDEPTRHKTGKTPAQLRTLASFKAPMTTFLACTKGTIDDVPNVDSMTAMSSFET